MGLQQLFKPEDILPLVAMGTLTNINKTRDSAEVTLKSLFGTIDTKDTIVSEKLFKLVFNELYIYKDFSERED